MLVFQKKKFNLRYGKISLFMLIFFILDISFKKLAFLDIIPFNGNQYLALGLDILPQWVVLTIHAFLTLFLIYFLIDNYLCEKNKTVFVALFLMIIGAFSNLVDRVFNGFVIDYLNLYFFQNNLADIYIWAGAIIFITYFFKKNKN
jgi:lipoprotein signal peptidase